MSEEIVRQKVIIDPEIVSNEYSHGGNSTKYCTYMDTEEMNERDLKLRNGACFSDLLGMLKKGEDHDRVYYKMEEDSYQTKLTEEEKHRWISLCVEYGTMPKCVVEEDVDKKVMIIEIDKNVSPSILFVYLCCFRYFREDTGFIRSVVYLVDKCNMNYYAAFVLASRICMNYALHHCLNVTRQYGEKFDLDKVTAPLHQIIGLTRFISDPQKYDSRGPRDYNSGGSFNQFRCADTIQKISSVKCECLIQDLFDSNIIKAIMASSDDGSEKYLNKFLSYRDKITYKEKGRGKNGKKAQKL